MVLRESLISQLAGIVYFDWVLSLYFGFIFYLGFFIFEQIWRFGGLERFVFYERERDGLSAMFVCVILIYLARMD